MMVKLREDELAAIGNRLKELRNRMGLSIASCSKYAGISKQIIKNTERGASDFSISTLLSLSRMYCITPNYILGIESRSDFDQVLKIVVDPMSPEQKEMLLALLTAHWKKEKDIKQDGLERTDVIQYEKDKDSDM